MKKSILYSSTLRFSISILILIFSLQTKELSGYPSYIAFGYSACATCHYSPNGGSRVNAYGKSSISPLLQSATDLIPFIEGSPDTDDEEDLQAITGFDDDERPQFQYEIGGQVRALIRHRNEIPQGESSKTDFIPMLTEINTYMARGPISLYLSLSGRKEKAPLDKDDKIVPFSREHWLMLMPTDETFIKLGRMTIPFGLKTPDHTRLTRNTMELLQYDQEYGVEISALFEKTFITSMLYFGNHLVGESSTQNKGASASLEQQIWQKIFLGTSILFDSNDLRERQAYGFHTRIGLPLHSYILAEWQQRDLTTKTEAPIELSSRTSFVRLGIFPREWVDTYIESGLNIEKLAGDSVDYRFGARSRVFSGIDLEFIYHSTRSPGYRKNDWMAIQVHAFH